MTNSGTKHKKQKTILIVEDEKILRKSVADFLTLKKYKSLEAKNGREGIELALKEHPDMILLDLIMPEVDGMTALKKIRQDAWGAHVPVIILTNLSATDEELVNDVITHKPMNYLIKSDWELNEITDKIENIFKTQDAVVA